MRKNWFIISSILGLIGGIIAFCLTGNWILSVISSIIVFAVIQLFNPAIRYMKVFYLILMPLLSNLIFNFRFKTEYLTFEAGIKELGTYTIVVLGVIALSCLILDYLERNDKLKGFFQININSFKSTGSNNITKQIINNK